MPNRLIIPLLLFAATVAFARGSATTSGNAAQLTHRQTSGDKTIATSFDVQINDDVRFAISVTNNTPKMVELRFPSGRTHDFYVFDDQGREIWRSSRGRLFTQAIQNKLLKSKATAVYDTEWKPGYNHGTFTAVAVLRSQNHPVESRVTFVLPGGAVASR